MILLEMDYDIYQEVGGWCDCCCGDGVGRWCVCVVKVDYVWVFVSWCGKCMVYCEYCVGEECGEGCWY